MQASIKIEIGKWKESLRRKNENNLNCNQQYKSVYSNKEVGNFYKKVDKYKKGLQTTKNLAKYKKGRQ